MGPEQLDIPPVVLLVFGFSFISNASPFFGASYTLFTVLELFEVGFSPFNFFALVVTSAVGATLAKVVIYYGAFGFKGFLLKNKNVRLIGRKASKGEFYLILFLAALLPVLPLDDFIYIGAGASSTSLGLMSTVTLLAKLIKSGFEVAVEYMILKDLGSLFGEFGLGRLDITVALSAAFLLIGIGIYMLDWEEIYHRFRRRPTGEVETVSSPGKPL